jgi:hypothetical protein
VPYVRVFDRLPAARGDQHIRDEMQVAPPRLEGSIASALRKLPGTVGLGIEHHAPAAPNFDFGLRTCGFEHRKVF